MLLYQRLQHPQIYQKYIKVLKSDIYVLNTYFYYFGLKKSSLKIKQTEIQ